MSIKRPQTLGEEIANSVSHGIGAGLSIAALAVLVTLAGMRGDAWRVVSFSVYGASMVLLYLASTLYHGFRNPLTKHVFHVFDHSAIFLLIAGTYTPFTLVTLRGAWGWSLFGVIWGLAFSGIIIKSVSFKRFRLLSVLVYVLMGWIALVALGPLLKALPTGGLLWLFIGGLCYTLGIGFYLWEKLPFHHAIWHLFVLGGSICHFFGIFLYVLPMQNA